MKDCSSSSCRSPATTGARPGWTIELSALAQLERAGGASLVFAQELWRGDELLASGRVKVACVDTTRLAPAPLPARLVERLRQPVAA
jgi:acyl-CoA thioesterase FadM